MNGNDDRQDTPETLDLPDTLDLAAVNAAEVEVVRLAAQRRIGPREALYFSRMLEHRRRAIGDETLEQTMKRLEEQGRKARGQKP
jgi:hypothetical protein